MLDSTSQAALALELAPAHSRKLPPRPQPIRDALLRYLAQPRRVADIARHIQRPVPTTTGHLAAMCRLGLAARLEYGVYARADYAGGPEDAAGWRSTLPAITHPPGGCRENHLDLRRRLLAALEAPRRLPEIREDVGASEAEIRIILERLWFSGLVGGDEEAGFFKVNRGHRRAPSRGPFARQPVRLSP